MKQVPL